MSQRLIRLSGVRVSGSKIVKVKKFASVSQKIGAEKKAKRLEKKWKEKSK